MFLDDYSGKYVKYMITVENTLNTSLKTNFDAPLSAKHERFFTVSLNLFQIHLSRLFNYEDKFSEFIRLVREFDLIIKNFMSETDYRSNYYSLNYKET